MSSLARRRSRLARRRGGMLLSFCLLGLPMLWLAGAFCVDVSTVLSVNRRAFQAAEAAALAGASVYDPSPGKGDYIDRNNNRAVNVANATEARYWDEAFGPASRFQAISETATITDPSAAVAPGTINPGHTTPASMTYTIHYRVNGLSFMGLAAYFNRDMTKVDGQVSATANLCTPGQNPYTVNGTCARVTG